MGKKRRRKGPRGPKYGTCPTGCGYTGRLTVHHILPRSLFGETKEHVLLCRDCHDLVEHEIQLAEKEALQAGKARPRKNGRVKLPSEVYRNIVLRYVKTG